MHPISQNQRHKEDQVDIFPRPKLQHTNNINTPGNGPVHVECSIMRNVMASASEGQLGGLFEKCQKSKSMRTALPEMGCSQPPTPVETDNTASTSIINGTAKHVSIEIDMRFYWV